MCKEFGPLDVGETVVGVEVWGLENKLLPLPLEEGDVEVGWLVTVGDSDVGDVVAVGAVDPGKYCTAILVH
eukprot:1330256-Amorphochlora_amoeboformis.AAC.1